MRGGQPCIGRTRIAAADVVELQREGKTPEEMLHIFAVPLSLSQVHSAMAYYDDHQEEIEAAFREADEVEAQIERDRRRHEAHPAGR